MADTHITIGDVSPRIQYTGDGTQTAFPFPFPIFAPENLTVYLDDAQATTGYTVTGAGNSAGGTVTFDTAPANGVRVTLIRSLSIQRVTDFQQGGAFRAKVVNDEMDYLTAALQQLQEALRRAPCWGQRPPRRCPLSCPSPRTGRRCAGMAAAWRMARLLMRRPRKSASRYRNILPPQRRRHWMPPPTPIGRTHGGDAGRFGGLGGTILRAALRRGGAEARQRCQPGVRFPRTSRCRRAPGMGARRNRDRRRGL